eukprot:s444_g17.t2
MACRRHGSGLLLLFVLVLDSSSTFCNHLWFLCALRLGPVQRAATSLQDAIGSLPNGCTLELPPGQYCNTRPIVINRNITLLGSNSQRTQLSGSFIFEVGAENAVLQDVDIVNQDRFVAVHLRCKGRPRVQGCHIESRGIGILADPPLDADSNPHVLDCRIGPAWQGLVIAGRCQGIFEACVISDCRSAGIRLRNDAQPVLRSSCRSSNHSYNINSVNDDAAYQSGYPLVKAYHPPRDKETEPS